MARKTPEPAVLARLSPTKDAIVYGPGRVLLVDRGHAGSPVYVSEREIEALFAAWAEYRPERAAAVLSSLASESTET